jgi:hypothetical protein
MHVDKRRLHEPPRRMRAQHRLDGRERIVEGALHEDLAQHLRHQHLAPARCA